MEWEQYTGLLPSLEESSVLRKRAFERDNYNRYLVTSAFGEWHERVPNGKVGVYAKRESDKSINCFLVNRKHYDNQDGVYVIDEEVDEEVEFVF